MTWIWISWFNKGEGMKKWRGSIVFLFCFVFVWVVLLFENWALKNWCFWTVVLEKSLDSPLDFKEIQPVHPKGDQSWVFIGRTDVEAETPILWPPDVKSWLIWKDPDAGKDWGQEEKGTTENEIAGWHHWLGGHESEWNLGVGDGQGGLVCCGSRDRKESDTTERLNWLTDRPFEWHFVLFEWYYLENTTVADTICLRNRGKFTMRWIVECV